MTFNQRNFENNPQYYARIAGILYLIIIATGIFGELFVRNKLIVFENPEATANHIIQSDFLWRLGIATDLLMHICDIPVMLILYFLLKPVSKKLALLNLSFTLIQTAILIVNKLNLVAALLFLKGVETKSFTSDQLHTLSYIAIKIHGYGFGIGLIFFGFVCLIEGYLIFKSVYLPKTIGLLMFFAGLCYLINSFTLLLAPQFSSVALLIPCFIAELSLTLWLIFKGVNISAWKKNHSILIQ